MLYQLFSGILDMALISCPVIIVILFVRGIMYPFPKKYRYFIWGIVGIRLICPFAVSSPASIFNLAETITMEKEDTSKTDKNAVLHNMPVDSKIPSGISGSLQDNVNINIQKKDNIPASGTGIEPFTRYGTFIWLAGIIIILSWNFYMVFGMKKHLERAVLLEGNIYECENIPSPFVLGIVNPKIYIPFQLGKEEQKYILKHEKYHIMRRDYIIKPASFLLASIYWFNPLTWLSYFLMVRDMEMSCDEYVLQNMDAGIRKDYSRSLLGFATNQRIKNAGMLSFVETDTRKRVVNVLNFKKQGKWIGVIAAALIVGAGASCLTNAYDSDKKAVKKSTGKTIKKTGNKEENIQNEVLTANTTIHGYDVQIVYMPDKELPDKKNLDFGMYSGKFAISTYKNNVKYAEYPLDFGINDMVYYPEEGFSLSVKDYNGDGENDDFALGQGQTPLPELGNFMYYQFFNVDKDGNITRYALSTKDGKNLVTIPDVYSKDFKCKNGEITYQALTEEGAKKQTASLSMERPVNNTENSFYFKDTGVTIGLPENKNWIQNPAAYKEGSTGIVQYYDSIAKTDVTLGFGKKKQEEITGLSEKDSFENEYWSFFPGKYEKLIEIQFHKIKDNKTAVVLSWEYNKINFYMRADFTGTEKNNTEWTSLAKTAAYIAENWYNVLDTSDNYIFSDEDIQEAKKTVKTYFKKVFEGCTIKKLWFNKDKYQRNVTYFSNLYEKDDIIILDSDFYVTYDYCKDNSLEKGNTYTNFMWVMSKNKNGNWEVETYGY